MKDDIGLPTRPLAMNDTPQAARGVDDRHFVCRITGVKTQLLTLT
jgi:hypothetical protein